MDIWKQAAKMRLTITLLLVGVVNLYQLWDASDDSLIATEEALTKELEGKATSRRTRVKKTKEIERKELTLALISDVLDTRERENEANASAAEVKAHNQRIDELIARKQEQKLADMSIEELEKLRK